MPFFYVFLYLKTKFHEKSLKNYEILVEIFLMAQICAVCLKQVGTVDIFPIVAVPRRQTSKGNWY